MSVTINSPKTPVTAGSDGVATATTPNTCKMPGPALTPLPNIGKSGDSPKGYSRTVKIEGKAVAIQGASFGSVGDMASKATGGGLVSANTHGPTTFAGPGSMDVKIEGKNVQLLSDPMFNNCGPRGAPANCGTLMGVIQKSGMVTAVEAGPCPVCKEADHGELKETTQTKADGGALASNFKAEILAAQVKAAALEPPEKVQAKTMLGVVECKCGKKYADQSAMTTIELCNAASAAGMKHMPGVEVSYVHGKQPLNFHYSGKLAAMQEKIASRLGNSKLFQQTWEEAEKRAEWSDSHRKEAASYPPGTCAAQGALVLLLDDGAIPGAMTEQWFSSDGSKTQAPIKFIDARSGTREVKVERFKLGETVPPCGACELIVPLLLCNKRETCSHKT